MRYTCNIQLTWNWYVASCVPNTNTLWSYGRARKEFGGCPSICCNNPENKRPQPIPGQNSLHFFFFFFFSPCCRRERVPVAEAFARLVERLHIKVPEGRHVVGVLDTSQDHHLEQIFTTIVSEIQEERKLCVGFEPALG